MSVEASTTFTVLQAETMPAIFHGQRGPERRLLPVRPPLQSDRVRPGRELAALEGTEAGYCTASGMGAIAAVVMQLCDHGDHVVVSDTVYGGTFALFHDFLPATTGRQVTFVDITDLAAVERAFTATKLILRRDDGEPDLGGRRLAGAGRTRAPSRRPARRRQHLLPAGGDARHARRRHRRTQPDEVRQRRFGHHRGRDRGRRDFITQLMDVHPGALMLLGPTIDPHVAFQLHLRLPHLGLRMTEHGRRAQVMAERLHERGLQSTTRVYRCIRSTRLLQASATRTTGTGDFSCDLETPSAPISSWRSCRTRGRFGLIAVSLGYFETLLSCSAISTSSEMTPEELARAAHPPGFVRISIGITGTVEQRWGQMKAALEEMALV